MRHQDIIDKRFVAMNAKIKKALQKYPVWASTQNDFRKFMKKVMEKFQADMKVKIFTVKVRSNYTFQVKYQTYLNDVEVVVDGYV